MKKSPMFHVKHDGDLTLGELADFSLSGTDQTDDDTGQSQG